MYPLWKNKINQACLVRDKHSYCNENDACNIQFVPMVNMLKDDNSPVYANLALAIVARFW